VAIVAAIAFYALEEQMATQIRDSQQNTPNFNFNR
jgi:hypothetical protein